MKRKKNIFLLVIICVIAIFTLNKTTKKKDKGEEGNIAVNSPLNSKKLSEIVAKSKRPSFEKLDEKSMCDKLISSAKAHTDDEIIDLLQSGDLTFEPECQTYERDDKFAMWFDMIYENCTRDKIEKAPDSCKRLLFWYKAYYLYRDVKDKDVIYLDTESLIQGIFVELIVVNFERLNQLVDELHYRLPNSPAVAKAMIIPKLWKYSSTEKSEKETFNKVQKYIDKAAELNPNDSEVLELEMIKAVVNEEDEVIKDLKEYNQNYQSSGLGFYYLAKIAWNKKNRGETIRNLELALDIEPNSINFKNALTKAKTDPFDSKIFTFSMSLNPMSF